mgnify:CR=1 FL=1
MIILDTNVLSALMQSRPDCEVVAWLDQQDPASVWLTTVTLFEARYGIALLADGKRKQQLRQQLEQMISDILQHRVLGLDVAAAKAAATLAAERKQRGQPVDMRDTFIAGIALAHRATLATRNVRHFADVGVAVINPWANSIDDDRTV